MGVSEIKALGVRFEITIYIYMQNSNQLTKQHSLSAFI